MHLCVMFILFTRVKLFAYLLLKDFKNKYLRNDFERNKCSVLISEVIC